MPGDLLWGNSQLLWPILLRYRYSLCQTIIHRVKKNGKVSGNIADVLYCLNVGGRWHSSPRYHLLFTAVFIVHRYCTCNNEVVLDVW